MLLLGAVVVIIGGLYFATTQANAQSMLVTLQPKEVKEKIDKGEDFSLYVYSDTCQYCKTFSPILETYLKEHDVKIYRVATTLSADNDAVHALLGEKFQGTPSIFSFKDGKIDDYFAGSKSKEELMSYAQKNQATFSV